MYSFGEASIRNMSGIDLRLKQVAHRAIEITKIDFGHGHGSRRRTAKEQQ